MSEIILTDASFEAEALQSPIPILVDFWAPWCGPCQMMEPIVAEVANELDPAKAKVGKLNVDDNQATAGKYNVLSIPTFIVFKGGKVVETAVGGMSKEKLKAMVERYV